MQNTILATLYRRVAVRFEEVVIGWNFLARPHDSNNHL